MNISSCKIGKYSTNKSGMKLPIVIPKELKMDVQRDIYNFLDKPIELKLISLADETVSLECEIDNTRKLKNSFKITFRLGEEVAKDFLPELYKFDDVKLSAKIEVNADEQKKRLKQISHDQRKKIYAIINDINTATGQGKDSIKQHMKFKMASNSNYETADMFSLRDCKKETANEFIEFLINFCLENGVPLDHDPKENFDNIEKYIYLCLKNKVCCICGRSYGDREGDNDPHHVDTIGAGMDRKTYDDSEHLKLPLCYQEHHPEIHTIGDKEFCEKYHVKPIKYKGD